MALLTPPASQGRRQGFNFNILEDEIISVISPNEDRPTSPLPRTSRAALQEIQPPASRSREISRDEKIEIRALYNHAHFSMKKISQIIEITPRQVQHALHYKVL